MIKAKGLAREQLSTRFQSLASYPIRVRQRLFKVIQLLPPFHFLPFVL